MDNQTLTHVVAELVRTLHGGTFGKVVQTSRLTLLLDFRATKSNDRRALLASIEPSQPRLYLTDTPLRQAEKDSFTLSPFALSLRKHLAGATLETITKDTSDRIVRFAFINQSEAGETFTRTLIAQLTGRSANLFLLDEHSRILDAMRPTDIAGARHGETYAAPISPVIQRDETSSAHTSPPKPPRPTLAETVSGFDFSPSSALEKHFTEQARARRFDSRAAAALTALRREIAKRNTLRRNLTRDLAMHGDPAAHKRAGDLLLANLATAERDGGRVLVVDYFADDAPTVEIEVDENSTLQEEAAHRFARYTKAKHAIEHTTARLLTIDAELESLTAREVEFERIIAARDDAALNAFTGTTPNKAATRAGEHTTSRPKPKPVAAKSHRVYRSSDNYEILVGRGARYNDELTFKVARPHDLWLHAADYPGAHVIIRNPSRGEIPHRTLTEAAQLAALNSEAKNDSRVSINYAARKFISKPKGSAPGLVRLSSFRTLLAEPRESGERI